MADSVVTTGKAFVDSNPKLVPNLIKIDVEVHSPEVIDGSVEVLQSHKPALTHEVFQGLWDSERGGIWEGTILSLFSIYGNALLLTDGEIREIGKWDSDSLKGDMQTMIFRKISKSELLGLL